MLLILMIPYWPFIVDEYPRSGGFSTANEAPHRWSSTSASSWVWMLPNQLGQAARCGHDVVMDALGCHVNPRISISREKQS